METATILVVCTGNIRRSPAIEQLLRHGSRDVTGLEGSGCAISSAGVDALLGEPIDPRVVRALDLDGARTPQHRARQLTAELIEEADLVLTAERAHRSAVVALVPAAVQRTFTVRELADLAALVGRDALGAPDVVPERLRALVRLAPVARARRVVGRASDDDLPDLRGRSGRACRRFADDVRRPVESILRLLEPAAGVSLLNGGSAAAAEPQHVLRRSVG